MSGTPPRQIDPKWSFETSHRLRRQPLNGPSFQDALRTFFQPIKNNDPRIDFYTMYMKAVRE